MTLEDILKYLFTIKNDMKNYKCEILVEDGTDDEFEYVEDFHISDEYNLKKYKNAILLDIFMPDDCTDYMLIHVAINIGMES